MEYEVTFTISGKIQADTPLDAKTSILSLRHCIEEVVPRSFFPVEVLALDSDDNEFLNLTT